MPDVHHSHSGMPSLYNAEVTTYRGRWTVPVIDGEQHGHVAPSRFLEGVRFPGPPVDGILSMLKQTRTELHVRAITWWAAPRPVDSVCRPSGPGRGPGARGRVGESRRRAEAGAP